MAKVIENKELQERKRNLKALLILIEQYVQHDKQGVIQKIKNEQWKRKT